MDRRTKKVSFLPRRKKIEENEGERSGGADLDEEMEKVFASPSEPSSKFDLASISADAPQQGHRYNEKDYSLHRKKSYPHTHVPLKALHTRLVRSKSKQDQQSLPSSSEAAKGTEGGTDSDTVASTPLTATSPEAGDVSQEEISEAEAPISERASQFDASLSDSPDKRVQFVIGTSAEQEEGKNEGESEIDKREHDRKRRKSRRKSSGVEDPSWRKRAGDNIPRRVSSVQSAATVIEESLEQQEEQELVAQSLQSHRFDVSKGKRRFSVKAKESSIARDGKSITSILQKKTFDHSPHEVFVQLDELSGIGEEREWKETARWIKYEEDVEEGAERWGRPHVAPLSFHSLLNLRKCLETGVILVDLEEKELPGVVYRVVEQMSLEELICEDDKPIVMRALLLRHRHVQEHDSRFRFPRRNTSSYSSLQNLNEEQRKRLGSIIPNTDSKASFLTPNSTMVEIKEETYMSSTEDLAKKQAKESILKRIPVGAEATTVLVGAVDFLSQPTIAFVRLATGIYIPSVTEVTIPVRFMFILLGPPNADLDYHEVGRSISTLMSNPDFHTIAYKATARKELLSAINEFLDSSIVLPPGDWERQDLLPFKQIKEKNQAIRRRQSKAQVVQSQEKKALMVSGDGDDGDKRPPDPLQRTKKPWGGLINDIKRRYPFYKSDFMDGLNGQCLSAAIFMYFAALSGAITFGGLMADKTKNLVGISETLISTAVAGIVFALLSGQPLVIIGATGPLLLFDESLFTFCQTNEIDYLTMRVYIGFWLGFIALAISFFEGSVFVKLFTRFTEEIFASLISLLYIVESVMKVYAVYQKQPLMTLNEYCELNGDQLMENSTYNNTRVTREVDEVNITKVGPTADPALEEILYNQPNTALFCTILALGTFFIAYYLRQFRNSKFLGRSARRMLGDFGVPIAIIIMVILDYLVNGVYTEKLKVPAGLTPSDPEVRGWIIPPNGLTAPVPVWVPFAAIVPSLLVYILLFMETHISELIIGKKERKLKKGSGLHLDIVLICLLNVGCGIMGAPFICAATVRSVTHVSAVTVMSRTHAPGEKPHIIEVKEQRVSGLVVSILVGMSVLMSPLLRLVPMAVLFGVFLYMGISSINGIQFFERCRLFFMPVKHHPQVAYVRRVQTMKMHLFTGVQLLCLSLLWVIRSSSISLAFPFFLILMVPLRAQLRFIFSPAELRALDSDEPDEEDDEEEPDFYREALLPG